MTCSWCFHCSVYPYGYFQGSHRRGPYGLLNRIGSCDFGRWCEVLPDLRRGFTGLDCVTLHHLFERHEILTLLFDHLRECRKLVVRALDVQREVAVQALVELDVLLELVARNAEQFRCVTALLDLCLFHCSLCDPW